MARHTIYLPGHVLGRLDSPDNLSGRIAVILDRYFETLRRTRIEQRFTEPELDLMTEACMSWLAEPAATVFGGVALELEDSRADGLAGKWGVDLDALLAKVGTLGPADDVALVEAIETRRRRPAHGPGFETNGEA